MHLCTATYAHGPLHRCGWPQEPQLMYAVKEGVGVDSIEARYKDLQGALTYLYAKVIE